MPPKPIAASQARQRLHKHRVPVAAGAACDRRRSRRQACQQGYPDRPRTQALRSLRRNAAQTDRSLASSAAATQAPRSCSRWRSLRPAAQPSPSLPTGLSRQTANSGFAVAASECRPNRSQPRRLGSGYIDTAPL
ncbi:Fibronectin type III domain protein [Pseudomonas chlororaphis subsp. aurantiaca]|nr:Fibronectin type III domain protein [Pseudomonas chlororaphis subsp. aurantiaca]